jgi:hypothetical protein
MSRANEAAKATPADDSPGEAEPTTIPDKGRTGKATAPAVDRYPEASEDAEQKKARAVLKMRHQNKGDGSAQV